MVQLQTALKTLKATGFAGEPSTNRILKGFPPVG
jgi:hypothetical protein